MPNAPAALALACLCLLVPAGPVRAQQSYNLNGAPLFLGDAGTDQAAARARVAEAKARYARWQLATLAGDYDRLGVKDPRWDRDARDGLTQYGQYLADAPALDRLANAPPLREGAKAALGRARAAGCTDPLVGCCALALGADPAGAAAVADRLEPSGYSPYWKFQASLRAAGAAGRDLASRTGTSSRTALPTPAATNASLDRARGHLLDLLRDPGTPPAAGVRAVEDFLRVLRQIPLETGDRACERLGEALDAPEGARAARDSAALSTAAGVFWAGYAWRGNDDFHADTIHDERWKPFQERLAKARRALENAWRLDPADTRAAIGLMRVERGQHESRERLETWFRRALDSDPDSFAACLEKLAYLDPRWYGDGPQAVEFGHQCQATRNWAARLPFILVEAHRRLAAGAPKPSDYWRRPDVWSDVRAVYEDCLAAARPDADYERSGFAWYACLAGRWKVAAGLFNALGDHPNLRAMGGLTPARYEQLAGQAAHLATMTPAQADALTAQDEPTSGSQGGTVDEE